MPFLLGFIMEWDVSLLLSALFMGMCAGGVAGTLAGLAGIGGGLIYVPLFYILFLHQDHAMAIAVFASMVGVVATAWFSTRSHWKLGHVDKSLLRMLLPSLIVGTSLGLWSTLVLPATWLLLGLAALNAWVAFDYGKRIEIANKQHRWARFMALPIGYVAGVFGVAGGTMLVPLLRRSLALRLAVGTSACCGLMMVASALVINLCWEASWQTLLRQHSMVLFAAWLGIVTVVPFTSAWAAYLHQSMPEHILRQVLKAVFSLIALVYIMLL
jgi:uncharacterized membrane protein YfcA